MSLDTQNVCLCPVRGWIWADKLGVLDQAIQELCHRRLRQERLLDYMIVLPEKCDLIIGSELTCPLIDMRRTWLWNLPLPIGLDRARDGCKERISLSRALFHSLALAFIVSNS